MSTAVACALVFNLGLPATPAGSHPGAFDFKQIDVSKNVSQLLRSNADHIWSYNRDPKVLKNLASYIEYRGTISGDPHLGNMTVIPVKTKEGQDVLRFLNVDFDDGGQGPFALEYARFVTVAKASSPDIRAKDLFAAYFKGLRGQEMKKPKSIANVEAMTIGRYEAARQAYVAKKLVQGRFKYQENVLEKWEGRPNVKDLEPLFAGSKVLEVAKRPMDRGGSLDAGERLWVLTQDKAGAQHITELKPYVESSLGEYAPQAGPRERVKDLHEVYWQGLDPKAYDIVEVSGKTYWLREKKVEILTYKNRAEEDEARIYIANQIGLTQSSQPEGAKLLKKIEQDPEFFKDAVKQYAKDYLKLANQAME